MTKQDFISRWQWFNNLILNVELTERQLEAMFSNLNENEIKAWISEVQCCYSGTENEEEANSIDSPVSLAHFYNRHPVTE